MAGTDFMNKLVSGFYEENPHMRSYFTTDEKLDYMEYHATGKVGNLGNRDDLSQYFQSNPSMKNAVDKFSELVSGGKSNVDGAIDVFKNALGINTGGSNVSSGGGSVKKK